ncbi:MAG: insulinase family protein, partial [Myxococcota bacterium]|nr:insulinase family protein [Myxococcota bacterium]
MTFQLADRPLPMDKSVSHGRLSNGLEYYIRHNQRPKNRAELRLVIKVGSIVEDEDQLGLAHLVEHMAFNGSDNFKARELVEYFESIGMRFGAHLNAHTSPDETIYKLQIPTDDEEIVQKSFLILRDWASNLIFLPEEIERERKVALEEWRQSLGAMSR